MNSTGYTYNKILNHIRYMCEYVVTDERIFLFQLLVDFIILFFYVQYNTYDGLSQYFTVFVVSHSFLKRSDFLTSHTPRHFSVRSSLKMLGLALFHLGCVLGSFYGRCLISVSL